MVRRRRNQRNASDGVSHARNLGRHFVARQLPAFARLGALRHFNFEFTRRHEIVRRDPKARGGNLFDGAALVELRINDPAVARWIFAAFTAATLSPQAVHRDGDRLMGFLAERPIRDARRREPCADGFNRLHVLQRHRALRCEVEEIAQGGVGTMIHRLGIVTIRFAIALLDGLMDIANHLGIEGVILTATTVFEEAARIPLQAVAGMVGGGMPGQEVAPQRVIPHATDPRRSASKTRLDDVLVDPDDLENLGAPVTANRRDPHLGHDLQDPVVDRFPKIGERGHHIAGDPPFLNQRANGLQRHVGIDRTRPKTDEAGVVMDFARITGLDEETTLHARAHANEVMVHRAHRHEHREGRLRGTQSAVAHEQEGVTIIHRLGRSRAEVLDALRQTRRPCAHVEERR